ncbi:MAG: zinc ABC transporter permease [Zetaproteobacteria bacterium CG06_land_8_20_14_3_00_59_53]|nr:MAG: zinc ABC transporter permease [Zetaproteobacteria bacterium CG2_30_59_37]PIO90862.1 MAG: zinc ABC transporter permease [Zetaproteobacteria bacterium CG23_combo_of_CG06-09_8_20_14_all_59_86]PIQ64663.1 MAG: zinc ABC transporter permease [Zetaproteobacteria bacterium CG11_big_fil_rev_8_21_14_0_20_59_439]PIU71172.1 MAG: zinc ABC transporter permease [Zetaproteobacteria bacterium CG06_land_8_20_14_3_00_59_53]PIU96665.1 MAG: zinc ABC transporter permease [Zetaproteobacteria bacterium CG03_lan
MSGFFESQVMLEALGPATLIAVVASSMSVMVLAHRLAFLAVGVSHATLAGLGIAVVLALPLLPTAAVSAVVVALLLGVISPQRGMNEDAATGVLFAGAMALGIVLLSGASKHEVDLFGLLFGNILMVSEQDRFWLICGSVPVLLALLVAARPWWAMAFDAASMRAMGLPVQAYRLMLYAIVGLTVVMCVKLAGIVLTAGMLVLPAASAWLWGRGLLSMWLLSLALSLAGTWLGLYVSYLHDLPSGATVVLLLCAVFLVSRSAHWLLHHRKAGQSH